MSIGSIILIAMGILLLIGLGEPVLKDFGIPAIAIVVLIGLIVGLNFIPPISFYGFTFSVGTAVLYLSCAALFILKGKLANRVLALLITLIIAGLLYGSTRISLLFGNQFWGSMNVFYGLIAGALGLIFARNGKYSFICSTLAVMTASLLSQIGGEISLNQSYDWAVVAGAVSAVLYTVIVRFLPSKPNKLSYYMEAAKMKD